MNDCPEKSRSKTVFGKITSQHDRVEKLESHFHLAG
jgi:hypothetical protein